MLRALPFQTIGDIGRYGLELHVYCPSCYTSRIVETDNAHWRDRLFAKARFRCTGQRHTGQPCAGPGVPKIRPHELLQVSGPVTLAFLWCSRCIWEIDQSSTSRRGQEAASAIAALAAVAACSGTYTGQRGGRLGLALGRLLLRQPHDDGVVWRRLLHSQRFLERAAV
jgi:hypothetical protein